MNQPNPTDSGAPGPVPDPTPGSQNPENTDALLNRFSEKAALVSTRVLRADTRAAALAKAVELTVSKPRLDPQMAQTVKADPQIRILAAPNLADADYALLAAACEAAGNLKLIREGLRDYPGGIDVGVTLADFGIAETGTLVLNSNSEETRLSTMLCERHVAILPVSHIRDTALSMADELRSLTEKESSYTAFITGASRTADIERVLALGVHGPLELYIILEAA